MEVNIPIQLTEDLVGTVKIRITLNKETRLIAQMKGYEPEELENLVGQSLTAIGLQVAEILGVGDSPRK